MHGFAGKSAVNYGFWSKISEFPVGFPSTSVGNLPPALRHFPVESLPPSQGFLLRMAASLGVCSATVAKETGKTAETPRYSVALSWEQA